MVTSPIVEAVRLAGVAIAYSITIITLASTHAAAMSIVASYGWPDNGGAHGCQTVSTFDGGTSCPAGTTMLGSTGGDNGFDYSVSHCISTNAQVTLCTAPTGDGFAGWYRTTSSAGCVERSNGLPNCSCPAGTTTITAVLARSGSVDVNVIHFCANAGGLYINSTTSSVVNPLTGAASCPPGWVAQEIGVNRADLGTGTLGICVAPKCPSDGCACCDLNGLCSICKPGYTMRGATCEGELPAVTVAPQLGMSIVASYGWPDNGGAHGCQTASAFDGGTSCPAGTTMLGSSSGDNGFDYSVSHCTSTNAQVTLCTVPKGGGFVGWYRTTSSAGCVERSDGLPNCTCPVGTPTITAVLARSAGIDVNVIHFCANAGGLYINSSTDAMMNPFTGAASCPRGWLTQEIGINRADLGMAALGICVAPKCPSDGCACCDLNGLCSICNPGYTMRGATCEMDSTATETIDSPTASQTSQRSASLSSTATTVQPRTPSMTTTRSTAMTTTGPTAPGSTTGTTAPDVTPTVRLMQPERLVIAPDNGTAVAPFIIFDGFFVEPGSATRYSVNTTIDFTGSQLFSVTPEVATKSRTCIVAQLLTAHEFSIAAHWKLDASAATPELATSIEQSDRHIVARRSLQVCIPPLGSAPSVDATVSLTLDGSSIIPRPPPAWVGVGLRLTFLAKAPLIPLRQSVAVATSGGTAAAVAFGGAGPGVAALAQRQVLLKKVSVCPRPLDLDPPPAEYSPTQWRITESRLQYQIGAAYGNLFLCLGYALLLVVIVEIMAQFVQVEGTGSRSSDPTMRLRAAANLGFPGKLAPAWLFFFQPTLRAALAVAVHGQDSGTLHRVACSILVVVLVIMFIVAPLLAVWGLVRDTVAHGMPAAVFLPYTRRERQLLKRSDGLMYRVLGSAGTWMSRQDIIGFSREEISTKRENVEPHRSTPPRVLFADRFGSVFAGFRPECVLLFVMDSAVAAVGACLDAYSPQTEADCRWVFGGVVAVFFTAAVVSMVRPYQRGVDNIAFALLAWLQLLVAVAMLSIFRTQDASEADKWAKILEIADMTLRILVLLWTLLQVGEAVYEFTKAKNALSGSSREAAVRLARMYNPEAHVDLLPENTLIDTELIW